MKVLPTAEPEKVKITGPGVANKSIPASLPVDFFIDATDAGYGDLEVQVLVSRRNISQLTLISIKKTL